MNSLIQRSTRRLLDPTAKNTGFTLFEALIAAAIISILAAILAPSFLGLQERSRVVTVQQMLYQAIRSTQMDAMQYRETRRFSLRQQEDHLEWASHPESVSAVQFAHWESFPNGVVLADRDNTFLESNDIYYVQFDFRGDVDSRLGTVTVTGANRGNVERCVIVSTLIGAMRKGEEHNKPNSNDRYCY